MIVEGPRAELVLVVAYVNQTETKFRDRSATALLCFLVNKPTQHVSGCPGKHTLEPCRFHEMAPPMFLVRWLWRPFGYTHQHRQRNIRVLFHVPA